MADPFENSRGDHHKREQTCTPFIAAEAPDYNNNAVNELLGDVKCTRKSGEAYAVFDWDNTCMFGDISYTSIYYQVDNLNFRLTPDAFVKAFSLGYTTTVCDECLEDGIDSVIGKDVGGNPVTLDAALKSIAADYEVLFDTYIGPQYKLTDGVAKSLDEVKQTTEYANFRAKFAFLVYGLEAMDGGDDHLPCTMKIGMTVFPQALVGMTEAEIRTLIKSSIRWNLGAAIASPSYTSTGSLAVQGSYTAGLRVFNGQESTMRALRANGVDVYIISASPQIFVEEVGSLRGLTYLVPNTNVYGVRFKFTTGYSGPETFTGELIEDYPITWGPGKAAIVNDYIRPGHNDKPPVYASGDSDGDCEMLATVRNGVVHTNNRLKSSSSCINGFYAKACEYVKSYEPSTNNAYLLQGQDKRIGSWVPSGFTTSDGSAFKSGVADLDGCAAYNFMD